MYGSVRWYDLHKSFGVIDTLEHSEGLYFPEKHVLLPPGQFLQAGDCVSFTVGFDRFGRPRAENIQRTKGVVADTGRNGTYLRSDMTAERPSRRDTRWQEAERLFGRK